MKFVRTESLKLDFSFCLAAALFVLYPLSFWPFSNPAYTFKYPLFLFIAFTLSLVGLTGWKKNGFLRAPASVIFYLFFLSFFLVFSLLFSQNLKTAFFGEQLRYEGFLTLIGYFLLFSYFSSFFKTEDFLKLKKLFLIALFLVSLIAIFEHFFFNPILYLITRGHLAIPSSRSFSIFANPTSLSTYLVLVLPLVLFFLFQEIQRGKIFSLSLFSFLAGFLALLFTYTRSSWLGFALSLFLFCFLSIRFVPDLKLGRFWLVFLLLGLIFLLVFFAPSKGYRLSERIGQLIELEVGTSGGNRLLMWKEATRIVKKYPLLGSGPDTFKLSFPRSKNTPWGKSSTRPLLDKAHNELIQLASTQGLGYLLIYLSLWIYIFLKSFSLLKKNQLVEKKALLTIALLSSFSGYLFVLQFLFSHYSFAPLAWSLAGFWFGQIESDSSEFLKIKFKPMLFVSLFFFIFLAYWFSISFWLSNLWYFQAESLSATNPAAALEFCRKATTLMFWEDSYWLKRAQVAANLARSSKKSDLVLESEESLKKALQINPLNDSHYYQAASVYIAIAQSRMDSRQAQKAIQLAEESLVLNPYSGLGWLEKGNALGTLAEIEGNKAYYRLALESYLKALKAGEKTATVYYNLGWCYQKLKEREKAQKAYLKALQLNPNYSQAKKNLELLNATSQ